MTARRPRGHTENTSAISDAPMKLPTLRLSRTPASDGSKEDIREKLKAQEIEPTEFNVQSVIMGDSRLWERPLDRDFRDNMIASRNDDLDARVAILKENGNFKNVDTAMPVESLDDLEQYRSDRLTDGCDA